MPLYDTRTPLPEALPEDRAGTSSSWCSAAGW